MPQPEGNFDPHFCTHKAPEKPVTETRYKITLIREGQPSHQMAEMTATMSGSMLRGMARSFIDQDVDGLGPWFGGGMFKSLTVMRLDDPQD